MADLIEMDFPTKITVPPYCGVGVTIQPDARGAEITDISVDSTLMRRLVSGDVVTAVREQGKQEWQYLAGMDVYELMKYFRGTAGSVLELQVRSADGSMRHESGVRMPFQTQLNDETGKFELRLAAGGTRECPLLVSDLGTLRPTMIAARGGNVRLSEAASTLRSRISL